MRRDQYRSDAQFPYWGVRAIVLHAPRVMIGRIGFHESPDPPHLRALAPNAIEFGYSIFPEYRGRGFATEAVHALMNWCAQHREIENFVLSIAPENVLSQAIARRFGFKKVGEQIDECDGLEEMFLLPTEQFVAGGA